MATTLQQAIEEVLAEVASWGRSPATIRGKRSVLAALARATPQGVSTLTGDLRKEHFRDALLDLHRGASAEANDARLREGLPPRSGRSVGSLQLARATLRQFVMICGDRGWLPDLNAEHAIRTTATGQDPDRARRTVVTRRIPEGEWARLLDCAEHPRDRLLVACGLRWARRGSDLAFMRWADLHLDEVSEFPYGWVELFNPKRRRRVAGGQPMPISLPVRIEIDRYLGWFAPRYEQPEPGWPLFAAKLTPNRAQTRSLAGWSLNPVKSVGARAAGLAVKKVLRVYYGPSTDLTGEGSHTLRRSGGEAMDRRGGLEAAQMLLDHEHASQTLVYTGNGRVREELSRAMLGTAPPQPEPVTQPGESETPMAPVVDLFSRQRVG